MEGRAVEESEKGEQELGRSVVEGGAGRERRGKEWSEEEGHRRSKEA